MTNDGKEQLVHIDCGSAGMDGMLELPADPVGIVLFAHGSGSSRFSPRNNYVASVLRSKGLATLLIDLLLPKEDQNDRIRFDIGLLTGRLHAAAEWVREAPGTRGLRLGLFGASTGAAAALRLASAQADKIAAVVSRGGRPDMAGDNVLQHVKAPTLLIVGALDTPVIALNRDAYHVLQCEKQLKIVPRASHLFEEPGALEVVAMHAAEWFLRHAASPADKSRPPP